MRSVVADEDNTLMGKKLLHLSLLIVCCCFQTLRAQTPLPNCGVPYIDPQDSDLGNGLARDTLVYTTYFERDQQQRAFFVDVNAFGGQQVDRATVYAILPDSTRKTVGKLAFGNCATCVKGFAFVVNDSLMVTDVRTSDEMSLWLSSFDQPPFSLTGNLQTLIGIGRISGRLPFCAIGMEVEYDIYNNIANTTTEFATQILCPIVVNQCAISLEADINCADNIIHLRATLPNDCFSPAATVQWFNRSGWSSNLAEAAISFRNNEGWFYFSVEDECCKLVDSIFVEKIDFVTLTGDIQSCEGTNFSLEGFGGVRQFWELPNGDSLEGSKLQIIDSKILDQGIYIFNALDENGCEDTDSTFVQIIIPEVPNLIVSDACLGDTVRFLLTNTTAFLSTSWVRPDGMALPYGFLPNLQVSDFGTYGLSVQDTLGCVAEISFEIQSSLPPEVTTSFFPICDTIAIQLSPDSLNYQWENGTKGNTFFATQAGSYRVNVTTSDGCKRELTVEVPEADTIGFKIAVEHPECPNNPTGSLEILAVNPDLPIIYSIDGGNTYSLTSRFEHLFGGLYEVVVQDELGCIKRQSVEIIQPDTLLIKILSDTVLEVRPNTTVDLQTFQLGTVETYQWLPKSIDQNTPNVSFLANQDLDVRVIVEDKRGCLASDAVSLNIVLGDLYVPNVFSPDSDNVNDYFTLYSDGTSGEIIARLEIFDRWGTAIFAVQEIPLSKPELGWNGYYKSQPSENGIYTYQAIVRFGNGVKKLLEGDVTLMRKTQ